ncbi:hypothetical protein U1Q18_048878, partial [Sarracenia purpurea var. burkii]
EQREKYEETIPWHTPVPDVVTVSLFVKIKTLSRIPNGEFEYFLHSSYKSSFLFTLPPPVTQHLDKLAPIRNVSAIFFLIPCERNVGNYATTN